MNFQNDRYTLRLAVPADDAGIRAIFAQSSFSGGIGLRYLRGESPVASFRADGEEARLLVILDNQTETVAAVGGAVVREEYLGGVPAKCAYLTGLKIRQEYRKQILFIPQAYRFLHGHLTDCTCCYTTILDENESVIRMMEKQHRHMPEYRYLGHYTTYAFHDGKKLLPLDGHVENAGLPERFSTQSLSPARHYPGFGEGRWYAYHEGPELLACCYVGNQSAYKQYEVYRYGGVYRLLSKLPTRLLGYPAFPKEGTCIRYGAVSRLWVKDDDAALCQRFLRTVAAEAGLAMLLWGGFENHPLGPALDRMKTVHYGSRLYEVLWDKAAPRISGVIGMEAALL